MVTGSCQMVSGSCQMVWVVGRFISSRYLEYILLIQSREVSDGIGKDSDVIEKVSDCSVLVSDGLGKV